MIRIIFYLINIIGVLKRIRDLIEKFMWEPITLIFD